MLPRVRSAAGTLFRFVLAGAVNTLFGFGIIVAAMALGVEPNLANLIGYAAGLCVAFALQRWWVFSGRSGHPLRFLAAVAVAYLINLAVLNILLQAGVPPIAAQAGAAVSYTLSMLTLSSLWVFRERRATVGQTVEGRIADSRR